MADPQDCLLTGATPKSIDQAQRRYVGLLSMGTSTLIEVGTHLAAIYNRTKTLGITHRLLVDIPVRDSTGTLEHSRNGTSSTRK